MKTLIAFAGGLAAGWLLRDWTQGIERADEAFLDMEYSDKIKNGALTGSKFGMNR